MNGKAKEILQDLDFRSRKPLKSQADIESPWRKDLEVKFKAPCVLSAREETVL